MRFHNNIICVVCFALAGALLYVGVGRLDGINKQRSALKLVAAEPLKNAPPSLAFATVAMGAFRGLVVDALWIRADKLKMEGQYFDAGMEHGVQYLRRHAQYAAAGEVAMGEERL